MLSLSSPSLQRHWYLSSWDVSLLPFLWLLGWWWCFLLVKIVALEMKEKQKMLTGEQEPHAAGLQSHELLRCSVKRWKLWLWGSFQAPSAGCWLCHCPVWGLQQLWLWFSSRFALVTSLLAGLALQRCPCSPPCQTPAASTSWYRTEVWEPLEDLPRALC